jgi:phosphatidylglycerophosphate synthase
MDEYSDPDRPKLYSYTSINKGLFDRYVMGRLSLAAVRYLPRGIAPNAVSILGSLFCWLAFLILSGLAFGPIEALAPRSPWIFGVLGALIMLYQLFDNLDGVQARRIGSSGPLGEFIDHWLDSLNAFMLPLGIALAFPCIPPLVAAAGVFVFALADWLCGRSILERGVMEFAPVGGEEGLCIIYAFFFSVWILGYGFWATPSSLLGFPPIWIIYVIVPLAYLLTVLGELEHCARAKAAFAAEIATLLPMLAWIALDLPRDGSRALLVGGLVLGGAGTRFAGEVLRVRLVGLRYVPCYWLFIAVDAALLASVLVPGLPPWAPMAAALASLAAVAYALASQFLRMVGRVKAVLGTGLFRSR